jgi:hypothetical protein
LPAKVWLTTVASKWTPSSPFTLTGEPGKACSIKRLISSG